MMPYRVNPDGSIQADTVDEAIELSRRLAGGAALERPRRRGRSPRARRGLAAFLALLNDNQRRALALIKQPQGVSLEGLRTALGMESNNAVAGVLAGLRKNLEKARIDPETVLRKEVQGTGRSAVVTYLAGPVLQAVEGMATVSTNGLADS